MAWIESHQEIARHPKTKRLARALDISLPAAVGHLHFLWWWAMDYAQDGDLSRFSPDDIADACAWDGDAGDLCAALADAGFLDMESTDSFTGVGIHDWQQYAGRLLAKRRSDVERARTWRESKRSVPITKEDVTQNVYVTNGVTVPHRTKPDRTVPNRTVPTGPEAGIVNNTRERSVKGGANARRAARAPAREETPSAAPAAPSPETDSGVEDAPRPPDRFGQTLAEIRRLDPGLVVAGDTRRNAKAVNEAKAEPALIAEAYVALMHGDWFDEFLRRRGSLHAVVDGLGGYVNLKAGPKRAAVASGSGRDWDAEYGG